MEAQDLPVCRYCLDREPENELLLPCKCTTPVHASCLCRWLAVGDRDAATLRCELCNERLRAKWSLAPLWSLFMHKDGQSILVGATLRGLYSLFLFCRIYKRFQPLVHRWRRPCRTFGGSKSKRARLVQAAALCRDTGLAMVLLWLSSQMLVRLARSFFRMTLRFRKAHGRLVLLDAHGNTSSSSSRLERLRISLRAAGGPAASGARARGEQSLAWRSAWELVARGLSEVTMSHLNISLPP